MTESGQKGPQHVAIIMDGNGRWAQAKGLPRTLGHRAGTQTIKTIVEACPSLGIRYLTVYAFSTENWKRPTQEVSALMGLLGEYIDSELERLKQNGVKVQILGDLTPMAQALRSKIQKAVFETMDNDKLVFSIALNYGGRQELLRAAKKLAKRALNGEDPDLWTEADLAAGLYTAQMPDPDLLIRTGGELRLSNFLLWQMAYGEIWTTPAYWPDFTPAHLAQAIQDFQERNRRFGGI